ncbi:hypothetical protein, partial [Sphaerotilus sp.]|uniref:hypothetical protein n=1 Tax=Sphaerotilus sp. TaxID=2093942 RepID=UPI0034E20F5F
MTHAKAKAAAREKRLISILMRIPLNGLQAHRVATVPDGTAGQRQFITNLILCDTDAQTVPATQ